MSKLITGLLIFQLTAGAVAAQDVFVPADTIVTVGVAEVEKRETFSVPAEASPLEVRSLPPGEVEALKKTDDYWYANREPEKPKSPQDAPKKSESIFAKAWFQNLLWIIILCSFLAVVVWYLAISNVGLFRRQAKQFSVDEEASETTEDIFSLSFDNEIARAEQAQNFRLALRLWYLKTLKTLSDKTLIDYRPERPNGDYVLALYGGRFYQPFARLTRSFEYTWYGQFPLSAEAYQAVKTDFRQFQNSLSA